MQLAGMSGHSTDVFGICASALEWDYEYEILVLVLLEKFEFETHTNVVRGIAYVIHPFIATV